VQAVGPAELVAARERYLARHPTAIEYARLADFALYALRVEEARSISGFGEMGWLSGERLRQALTT
jgi:hypothetical protein